MVKVLYVNGNVMKRGGIEAFMMNYFRSIDKTKVKIDFLVHGYGKGVYDDEIIAAGSAIHHVPTKSKHPIRYAKELKRILVSEKYDIIHSHLDAMSGWVLKIAKECGVPVRIAHSHNTDHLTNNKLKRIVNDFAKKQIPLYATDLFACSRMAGEWLFGRDAKFFVVKNALPINKFKFDYSMRREIRNEHGWNDKIILGHVGRFDYQKNQEFLIELLQRLLNASSDYRLVFIGAGDDMENIKVLAEQKGVLEKCYFMGSRSDVNNYYNAFDIFLLPSRFEGLGIVAIEAQVNGLPSVVSNGVPEEAVLCENVIRLDLAKIQEWEKTVLNINLERNEANAIAVERAGYSIEKEAAWIEDFYISRGLKK